MKNVLVAALLLCLPGLARADGSWVKLLDPRGELEAILNLPGMTRHETRDLEGWQVRVDVRLLSGADAELGARALRALAGKLSEIKVLLPPDRLAKLQKVTIVLDRSHPLRSMQYHPSAGWLKEHGYDPALAR